MRGDSLKTFLGLDEILGVFKDDFIEWSSAQYPRNGIILPKKNKII